MQPDTLNASTVRLVNTKTGAPETATVTPDSNRSSVTLAPSAKKLATKTRYEVTIEGEGNSDGLVVKDLAGNDLSSDFVWSFKAGKKSGNR